MIAKPTLHFIMKEMNKLELCIEIKKRIPDTNKDTLDSVGLKNHYRRLVTYINKNGESIPPSKKGLDLLAKLAGITFETKKIIKYYVNI